jgi:hypothetical protein
MHFGGVAAGPFLDISHHAADPRRRMVAAGKLEMAPCLAPQAGVEGGLGDRDMAFEIVDLLLDQSAHEADAFQRIGLAGRREVKRGEIGMRRKRPGAFERLHGPWRLARLDLQFSQARRHRNALGRQAERFARQAKRIGLVALAFGLAAALHQQQRLQRAALVGRHHARAQARFERLLRGFPLTDLRLHVEQRMHDPRRLGP